LICRPVYRDLVDRSSGTFAHSVVAPNGATTHFIKDDFGRTVATIGADSDKTTRRFDAADRLVANTGVRQPASYESVHDPTNLNTYPVEAYCWLS
jgi:hypothetical protein